MKYKNIFCILDSTSSVCRDFIRNVCKRGLKCRFSHVLPDSEDGPQDKRQRQNIESNSSYIKNDTSCIGGNRQDQKDSMLKEKHGVGPPMQLKVSIIKCILLLLLEQKISTNLISIQLRITISSLGYVLSRSSEPKCRV